jgi:N-acetylmuramoyl-L-alanine amidase
MESSRPYLIVLDPGHGGEDPGAVGVIHGGVEIRESDVNLDVARILERHVLDGDFLFRPLLTRTGDVRVSLQARCDISNRMKPDAFVSIHCNAAENKRAEGFEVWTSLGQTVADSLATELYWALQGAMPDVHGRSDYDDGDVDKEKSFFVLRHTTAPAVLLELDFLSNDARAEWLVQRSNQEKIVKEIADAIEFWLEGGK